MAHPVLVLARHLAEGRAEGRIEEQRVVAEAVRARAARRRCCPSTDSSVWNSTSPSRATATALVKRAPRFSRRHCRELLEQQPIAVGVGSALAAEAARVETGAAGERVDDSPESSATVSRPESPRVVARLQGRVLEEGAAGLLGCVRMPRSRGPRTRKGRPSTRSRISFSFPGFWLASSSSRGAKRLASYDAGCYDRGSAHRGVA